MRVHVLRSYWALLDHLRVVCRHPVHCGTPPAPTFAAFNAAIHAGAMRYLGWITEQVLKPISGWNCGFWTTKSRPCRTCRCHIHSWSA